MKKILTLLLITLLSVNLVGCNREEETDEIIVDENTVIEENPVITITVRDYGVIKVELYPDVAPNTVYNFIKNVEDGIYTDNEFHRIIEDFMIQGGQSDASCTIEAEVNNNPSFDGTNELSHERGVISMARTNVFNSATSQFFIVHEDSDFLDENYAAFGKVTEGLNILDQIAAVQTSGYPYDQPLTTVEIESITVDTFGYVYPDPVCE